MVVGGVHFGEPRRLPMVNDEMDARQRFERDSRVAAEFNRWLTSRFNEEFPDQGADRTPEELRLWLEAMVRDKLGDHATISMVKDDDQKMRFRLEIPGANYRQGMFEDDA